MLFDEFALICTYSAISVSSQANSGLSFFLVFLMHRNESEFELTEPVIKRELESGCIAIGATDKGTQTTTRTYIRPSPFLNRTHASYHWTTMCKIMKRPPAVKPIWPHDRRPAEKHTKGMQVQYGAHR
jgi:hypothetical protein